jgi:predicted secreted hydrolase
LRDPTHGLDLTINPRIPNQELALTVPYWEGAVAITGSLGGRSVSGSGYVELTGYTDHGNTAVRARGE